ncbi:pyridoxamine 5'-phosphate oxidase family protein [Paenibacillus aurantius]|uniref:Pyridoxamine 5'-phosphate oxidase family protein n=1 Tax=Paenibacillus aurantius TaxID=2918900 RepID=A0AA96RG15_9BACL|nr:pyridoxamine 5'-phosphate oxidase family protein [Paenibacillus aurantius]WNQ09584.1 pyridoxamine 5'-phosphate oxidase family protein [Paenibacillus aurantius]
MNDVFHDGELAVQALAGERIVAEQNGRNIQNILFKGAAAFLRTQSLLIASTAGKDGKVWCSFLTGEPGFLHVTSETELTIVSRLPESDPLRTHLKANPEIGLLAIDFSRRIRMRINGKGEWDGDRNLTVTADQVYGNCPKYIQKRSLQPNGGYRRTERTAFHSRVLEAKHQEWIGEADTFFVGSVSPEGKMDASHRGGPPGFVTVVDDRTLLFPDYFGNSMFNTLGNIYSNPSTGLLFLDFDGGHSLQLTGRSEIVWDKTEAARFPGAERLVRFEMDDLLHIENNTPIHWEFCEYSPANPL